MKTKIFSNTSLILSMTILLFLASSCSKAIEKLIEEPENTENILVEESPWVFSKYEISMLEDDGGSGLSSQEIEKDINQYIVGVSFTFNDDGTGFIDIPEQGREEWVWSLGNNRLTTISDTQTNEYTFFSTDRNQMNFESRTTTIHMKNSMSYNITHVGKYTFK